MTFNQAVEHINTGKKLSRKGWGYLFGWYHITHHNNHLVMNDPCNGKPSIVRQWEYIPTTEDLEATDWEVIEEIRSWR